MSYSLEGPFPLKTAFNPIAGIYLIGDANRKVVDVGQTQNLEQRMASHEREECWNRNGAVQLWFLPVSEEAMRLQIEAALREEYAPVCGVR